MKIVTFSTLYPNAARPNHGIFVETRLRQLLRGARVEARVVAPVPWFPSAAARFGSYAAHARAPREEERHGIRLLHPRYAVVPKVGMIAAPFLLAAGAWSAMAGLARRGFEFDLIDAHYFYPDGVAAAIIGQRLNKPVVITARGSDVNLLPSYVLPRRMILWAARRAAALVTVSAALKAALERLGVDGGRITVLRNGVDTTLFRPGQRAQQRARLGVDGTVLLSVGNLVENKGHDLVLHALAEFPGASLLVIGAGPQERRLKELAAALGLQQRVRFPGTMPQEELAACYGAADALVLASSREGWPNVLLESMACGTPVVSTRVGGIPEIVAAPEAGVLAEERSTRGLAQALRRLLQDPPDRGLTRRYAERFGWEESSAGQLELFERVLAQGAGA